MSLTMEALKRAKIPGIYGPTAAHQDKDNPFGFIVTDERKLILVFKSGAIQTVPWQKAPLMILEKRKPVFC